MHCRWLPIVMALFISGPTVLATRGSEQPASPLTAEAERRTFRLADSRVVAEVVLAEPEITAPVALNWDAAGRLYVVQMTDYPSGPGSGSILQFTDTDGDGRYERRTRFADGLSFPNGILPWQDGMLITAAPDIWFCRDRNDDGIADDRERLLTGFAEGNQQLRVNGLFWGLDNWIYGANGRSDGEVRWGDSNGPTRSIRRRDFRFRPEQRRFEAIAGNSQFGTAHDDWGRRFPVFNNLPVRQVVIEDRYLDSASHLDWPEAVPNIAAPDDLGRVYALTPASFYIPQPAGFSTSACGPAVMRAGGLGEEFRGDIFVCEPAQNLVTRRHLRPGGVHRRAGRPEGETDREFLAATDPWFHPVYLVTGPDGTLWMVDFYRKAVEHPDWVVQDLRERIDWREGASHGRIWRIRRQDLPPEAAKRWPAQADCEALVDLLEHENGWWRDTAQRLLVERRDASVVSRLERLALSDRSPIARLHALHTLVSLSNTGDDFLAQLLASQSGPLCEHVLVVAEPRLRAATVSPKLMSAALALASHPDDRLRFQLALSLQGVPSSEELRRAVVRLAGAGSTDPYQRAAVLAAVGDDAVEFARRLLESDVAWKADPREDQLELLADVYHAIGATCRESEIAEVAGWLAGSEYKPALEVRLWESLLTGLQSHKRQSSHWPDLLLADRPATTGIKQRLDAMTRLATDAAAHPATRVAAIRVGAFVRPQFVETLQTLLVSPEPIEVQRAAMAEILKRPERAKELFDDWPRYGLAVRQQLLRAATERSTLAAQCVEACHSGLVAVAEIDPSTLNALRSALDGQLRERVDALIAARFSSDRQAVVEAYRECLSMPGDRVRGASHFAKVCLSCHRLEERGGDVGPNLSAIATHAKATLLVEILDPSRQVLPDYAGYVCVTQDGRSLVGRIAAETGTTVTIRRVGEPDFVVSRAEIDELRATGKSVMPDGLENGLSLQDVADLLEFLQTPDVSLLAESP